MLHLKMETVETPQTTTPIEQKSRPEADRPSDETNWTKIILAAVLGIGLLAGSAYAGYYYGTQQVSQPKADRPLDETPEPTSPPVADPTADWRTYTDDMFVSVQLPPSWQQLSTGGMDFSDEKFEKGVTIVIEQSAYDRFTEQAEQVLTKGAKPQSVVLAGVTALRYEGYGGEAGRLYKVQIVAQRGINAFLVTFSTPALPEGGEDVSVFDQILSTFKFLEVEDQTKDWKTYTDTTNNFSLKYPPSWQVTKGNEHAPSIPSSMTEIIKMQSNVGTVDVSIIPWHNNLKKDLREELSSFISRYFGDVSVSYENTQLDNLTALKGSYLQSAFGSQTKGVLTAVEKDTAVFFLQTQFDVKNTSRLTLYNQILSTFKFLE